MSYDEDRDDWKEYFVHDVPVSYDSVDTTNSSGPWKCIDCSMWNEDIWEYCKHCSTTDEAKSVGYRMAVTEKDTFNKLDHLLHQLQGGDTMADSQSRYSIIDELTEKMNKETEFIANLDKQITEAEGELQDAQAQFEFDKTKRERKLESLRSTSETRKKASQDKIQQLKQAIESLKEISEGAKTEQK